MGVFLFWKELIILSATFWNMRRRKRAELAKQQAPIEAEQVPKGEKKSAKKVKKKDDK